MMRADRAPNDEIHGVVHVVHRNRELVGPVAVAILQQQIAALLRRRLHDRPQRPILELLRRVIQFDANARSGRRPVAGQQTPRSACPRVALVSNLLARAGAYAYTRCVDCRRASAATYAASFRSGGAPDAGRRRARTPARRDPRGWRVRRRRGCGCDRGPRCAAARARRRLAPCPHVNRVHDVTEVKVAGGRGGAGGDHGWL